MRVVNEMKLSEENKERIVKEIQFVIENMKATPDMDESLYYLSAIHSIINRIFNIEFNRHLTFIHFVLINCYGTILKAVTIARQGKQPITIDSEFFTKLTELLDELANAIKEDKTTFEILEKISVLTYSISGNGYFLQKKGIKVIDF